MQYSRFGIQTKEVRLGLTILGGLLLLTVALLTVSDLRPAYADPIDPPEGYPKLTLSVKTVTPTLAGVGGATLDYAIEIHNTGAYTAVNTTLTDLIPNHTTYNNDAQASAGPAPSLSGGNTLTWSGDVGFDTTVVISFSVTVEAGFSGIISNTAVISQPRISRPVTAKAETLITDDPVLAIGKTAAPARPGANKPLVYTLVVTNQGQPANNLPITVTDRLPLDTGSPDPGPDGTVNGDTVTWRRNVTLDTGETTAFTFSVTVDDVLSGTVITNDDYRVVNPLSGVAVGEVHTATVIDPIFFLAKEVWPDPPGSNREATYTLTLLNKGSLATNLVITDRVPSGVTYQQGGESITDGVVSWSLPSLDTGESAKFTYTVSISDVADIEVINDDYAVCSAEEVCRFGQVLTSVVEGPIFETTAMIVPIAKKPGGEPITPTLTVRNVGNGNALDVTVVLTFYRMSLTDKNGISAYFADGSNVKLNIGPNCPPDNKCRTFSWMGDIAVGEMITFTLSPDISISTIGGEEGDQLIATINVTDTTSNGAVFTGTSQAFSKITHFANVSPIKSGPAVIGRGQLLTYTIVVRNSGFTTDFSPVLTDVVPLSTTLVSISDGGQSFTGSITTTGSITGVNLEVFTVVSWTLDIMGPGDVFTRSFTVLVDEDLISGTQIVNNDYIVFGYGNVVTGALISGPPVTTTVQEVGLIDSYKVVTPTTLLPGIGNVLTYALHIVNSSGVDLTGVTVYDLLPWEFSTYQRDAVASAGTVISDIVSLHWTGDVAAFSEEVVTMTVVVDPNYEGPLTNTATIEHESLLSPVDVQAIGYVTDQPVLQITKSASPDPVKSGAELVYTVRVVNLGQQATNLVITDVIPADTTYVASSATAGGELVGGDHLRWQIPVLESGDSRTFKFRVTIEGGRQIVNDQYAVTSAEGVIGIGAPVITLVRGGGNDIYLPVVLKN
jgi:uncharacterized repeat protein (TIGR01451 family)